MLNKCYTVLTMWCDISEVLHLVRQIGSNVKFGLLLNGFCFIWMNLLFSFCRERLIDGFIWFWILIFRIINLKLFSKTHKIYLVITSMLKTISRPIEAQGWFEYWLYNFILWKRAGIYIFQYEKYSRLPTYRTKNVAKFSKKVR